MGVLERLGSKRVRIWSNSKTCMFPKHTVIPSWTTLTFCKQTETNLSLVRRQLFQVEFDGKGL